MIDKEYYVGCGYGREVAQSLLESGIDINKIWPIPMGFPAVTSVGFMMGVQAEIANREKKATVLMSGDNDKSQVFQNTFDPKQIISRYGIGREM